MQPADSTPPPGVVELREDIPLKAGSGGGGGCGTPRLIAGCFAVLSVAVTVALLTQIYYGDYQVVPHGSVSSAAEVCSAAGTGALKAGGRALDAAAAAALCLTLLAPHRTSIDAVNLSSEEPSWTVRGLEWDVRFRLEAVAVNGKGRSAPARLDDVLFRDPEKRTASETGLGLGGTAGAVGALGLGAGACALLAGACALSRRRRARAKPPPAPAHAARAALAPAPAPDKRPEHDDAEPDLIPNNYCETVGGGRLTVASPARTAPTPLSTPACNGPGASWTWGARPRELAVGAPAPPAALGRSASATLRAAADLNVDAIKEKLLDHRIPESCV